MIAEVIIDSRAKKLNRKFDYEIPKNLEDLIFVGSRVLVPFANFKTLEQGYVIKIKEKNCKLFRIYVSDNSYVYCSYNIHF